MSEQILQDRPGQPEQDRPCLVDTHGQPNDRRDLVAMTDLELQRAYQELSATIEALRPVGTRLSMAERLAWEIDLLVVMYRRESIQFEQIYRSMEQLDQSRAASRECPQEEGRYA